MGSLQLSLAVLVARGHLAAVNQGAPIQVESCSREPNGVSAQFVLVERLLGDVGVALGMDVLGLHGRNIAPIARNGTVFGQPRAGTRSSFDEKVRLAMMSSEKCKPISEVRLRF